MDERTKRRSKGRIPSHTTLGCPMAHGRATWCRGLCDPIAGYGVCGRIAPHAMLGRTQLAIANYKAKQAKQAK